MLNSEQYFELDNTFLNYDYFYISKIVIPIDFYLFQTGYEYVQFEVFENDVDPGTTHTYFFELGSPSAFDIE